jgi:23S rRNA (guanosine2251-2'-O)-methyltransferase
VGLTAVVAKASAGAGEYMKVARVTNITAAIEDLKKQGVWIFCTAAEGSVPMYQADLKGPAAIVIGSEGDGMSRLVQKSCDVTMHIPMKGRITSLNASAAASILLYEAVRQRLS